MIRLTNALMHLPTVQPISISDIYVNGDVTIHETAVVAPGTILQAAANSQIVIGAGVCLGMGVILNAYQGAIEIEEGAILGPGVLVIGNSTIGANACIGAISTIFNTSVDSNTVIPPGSVLGDKSRQILITQEPEIQPSASTPNQSISAMPAEDEWFNEEEEVVTEVETPPPEVSVEVDRDRVTTESSPEPAKNPVVGQIYINQLLFTLFPERESLNRYNKNSQS